MAQAAIVLRDDLNLEIRPTFYESSQGVNNKYLAYSALGAAQKLLINGFSNVNGGAPVDSPWTWMQSRNGNPVFRWVSYITKTNDRLRKREGLA
jgi:hypothetical protein